MLNQGDIHIEASRLVDVVESHHAVVLISSSRSAPALFRIVSADA
jgi:hypothetical protein